MATAGIPLKFTWHRGEAYFNFRFLSDPNIKVPTEIFVPSRWFSENPIITIKIIGIDGKFQSNLFQAEYFQEKQRLFVYNDAYAGEVELTVQAVPKGST
jgi:hypothetical protein